MSKSACPICNCVFYHADDCPVQSESWYEMWKVENEEVQSLLARIAELEAALKAMQRDRDDARSELEAIHALASSVPGMDPQDHETAMGVADAMRDELLARIAELERECERWRMRLAACGTAALGYTSSDDIAEEYRSASLDDVLTIRARAETAEAKVAELAASRLSFADAEVKAHNALKQAEAEAERLRCCGNCEHFSSSLYACELWPGHDKDAPESCHFAPSRWKEAER